MGLNKKDYKLSIKEMKLADDLIERILFLEGLPNLQDLGKLMIGEEPKECLECDFKWQMDAVETTRDAIELCEKQGDYVSRNLLEKILEE
ncbi:ferritin-like domain-containing protein [Magnetococcus sp. PR-3]